MIKRGRKSTTEKLPKQLTQKIVWFLVMFLGYLSYFADIRPYFLVNHGIYSAGFLDGLVVAITSIGGLFLFTINSFSQEIVN
jgi:hypothetical protein